MKKKEKYLQNSKGITLIALVVTIIVLIILAGISINLILGDNGIITKANEAKEAQEIADLKEKIKLEIVAKEAEKLENTAGITNVDIEEILSKYGTVNKNEDGTIKSLTPENKDYAILIEDIYEGTILKEYELLASKVKVGDYVEYNPTENTYSIEATYTGHTDKQTIATEDLEWRVLKVENNKVTLISANPTTNKLHLSGIEGYNNAVYILNNMCSDLYSKNGVSESARCLNFEDVKDLLSEEFWDTAEMDTYEKTITKTVSKVYPNIVLEDSKVTIDGKQGKLSYSEQNDLVTGSQTYSSSSYVSNYVYCPTASTSYYIDPIYYELFNGSIYLSTRTMDTNNGFRLYMMWSNAIAPGTLYGWSGSPVSLYYGWHPVVTLEQDVVIEKGVGEGTLEKPYIIEEQ